MTRLGDEMPMCEQYYTVAFRATGNVTLVCVLATGHAGLHQDRRGVRWTIDQENRRTL